MSKIICDICGTTYQDTADCCPICGCSRDSAMDFLGETFQAEEMPEEARPKKGRYSNKKRKEIFDYDEVNPQLDEPEISQEELSEEEEDDIPERPQSNTFAVIGLTVLIAGLLLATAFLVMRYILPNLDPTEPTSPSVLQTQAATETTGYRIPCQGLALVSGAAHLSQEGQYFLISVTTTPEDTTDEITYASADESIATVSADGRITAVSEGETVIYITCGNAQNECPVVVKYEQETEPPTEETTAEETEAPTEEATEAATEEAANIRPDVTLKLKKEDIKLLVGYGVTLELDCDLDPEDVEWSVEHEHIASVDEKGFVKAKKTGVTDVIVKYGDQEVRCIVRCEK